MEFTVDIPREDWTDRQERLYGYLCGVLKKYGSIRAIAKDAGIPQSTLNRQMKNLDVSADVIIAISRAGNSVPTLDLYESGILTYEEAGVIEFNKRDIPYMLSNDELLLILRARLMDIPPEHLLELHREQQKTPFTIK